MKRDTTQTIWRTVVFAGAMLGAPACNKKPAATTPPTNTQKTDATPTATGQGSAQGTAPSTAGDPCAGQERPRGTDDDGGGGVGRGFVLS
jgi:hypothetical protein